MSYNGNKGLIPLQGLHPAIGRATLNITFRENAVVADTGVRWIGRSIRRVEDARLVTGQGRFVGDLAPAGCLHLEFFRSPYARGAIASLDLNAARAIEGVVAVYTATDLGALGAAAVNPLIPDIKVPPFRLLADGTVEAVGQPVVAVVATNVAAARDAAACIDFGRRHLNAAQRQP